MLEDDTRAEHPGVIDHRVVTGQALVAGFRAEGVTERVGIEIVALKPVESSKETVVVVDAVVNA